MQNKHLNLALWSGSIILLMVVLILLSDLFFGRFHADMTADKRYSLDQKTKVLLNNMQNPVSVRLYMSKDLVLKDGMLGNYADYLRRLLTEYQNISHGKVELSFVEVVPFTSSQAAAEKAGIEDFYANEEKKYSYLGVSFTDSFGRTAVIPKLLPERQRTVEDDISRTLSIFEQDKRPVLGVVSPFFGIAESYNPLSFQLNWSFIDQLEASGFEIRPLSLNASSAIHDVDAVLVFYPLKLGQKAVYALDQYLLAGGRIIMVLDAFSEERYRETGAFSLYNSGVKKFLNSKGIDYKEDVLVGDIENARQLNVNGKDIKYPFWMTLGDGTAQVLLNHSGFFTYEKKDGVTFTELLKTGKKSGFFDVSSMMALNYDDLLKDYKVQNIEYPLVLLAEGSFEPLFVSNKDRQNSLQKEGKLALFADADMFNSPLWNSNPDKEQKEYEAVFSSDNFHFFRNVVDYMTDSGYIGLIGKNMKMRRDSLADVVSFAVQQSFEKQKKQADENLAEIKGQMEEIQSRLVKISTPSIKLIKDLEQLRRKALSIEEEQRKISYQIQEKYKMLTQLFMLLMIFVLPIISVLIVGGVYYVYRKKLMCRVEKI